MKKSIKLLSLTFLTTATISLPLTFLATSCSTQNNTSTTSNITIESQSPTDTTISTSEASPTLFVKASTNSTTDTLQYAWFVSKDNGVNWNAIENANTSSYQIPSTELNGITSATTYQYKVQITLANEPNISVTSNVYNVNIKPATSESSVNLIKDLLQSVDVSSDEDISLSVAASADGITKSLWYDWYLQKSDGTFNKVQHSTSSSFSLSSSDYANVKENTTWKVYAEIYPEGEESSKRTTSTCAVKIVPQTNTASTPTIPSPAAGNTPARQPVSDGLTTIQYAQEKYIANNSVSLLLAIDPNIDYLKTYLTSYISKWTKDDAESSIISNKYSLNLANNLLRSLNENKYRVSRYTGGTGWMLDYSIDSTNQNLVNYYLATNIHVLEANYRITFTTYVNTSPFTVTAYVPVNTNTVKDMSIYLSQPQYSETSPNQNVNVLADSEVNLASDWYKTSITKDNVESSLIPIGSYTDQGSPSLASPYSLQLSYTSVVDWKSYEYNYRYADDLSRATLVPSYSTKQSSDFAVLKISEPKNKFTASRPTNPSNTAFSAMYDKITTMFKVDTTDADTTKESSYIARLNKLLTLTSGNYNKATVDDLFMYYDYSKNGAGIDTVSIAGFPALWKTENKVDKMYVTVNSNTISYSLREDYVGTARQSIQYYYQGKLYNSLYNWSNNDMLKDMKLNAGSSGSMGVSDTYKIMGIYWGGIQTIKGSVSQFDGALTRVFSYNDDKSMIKVWLKYIKTADPNSKLLQLFTALESKGYFTS